LIAEIKHWLSQLPASLLAQHIGLDGAIIFGYQ